VVLERPTVAAPHRRHCLYRQALRGDARRRGSLIEVGQSGRLTPFRSTRIGLMRLCVLSHKALEIGGIGPLSLVEGQFARRLTGRAERGAESNGTFG
jgi:hypothetical protein